MPHPLLRFLRAVPAGEPVHDAELLRRFAEARDEAAFELLVRRHADGVWKVCRGILRQDADAEDAFQATFLALAKQAGKVRTPCAAGWLHRVAVHAALKLRSKAARLPTVDPADVPAPPKPDSDLAAAVHEELARLGESYRLPVVLCDLEGHTHAEAAKVLGWPVGTVSGRLSRARDQLRDRLARRGLAPAAVLAGSAEAPGHLVRAAVSAASGGASAAVLTLTDGVLATMRTSNLKLVAAAACVAVGLAGTGAMVAVSQEKKPADPAKPDPPAPKPVAGEPDPAWDKGDRPTVFPDIKFRDTNQDFGAAEIQEFVKAERQQVLTSDPPLRKLQKARLNELLKAISLDVEVFNAGAFTREEAPEVIDRMIRCGRDTVTTALSLSDRREDQRRWLEFGIKYQKYTEGIAHQRALKGLFREVLFHYAQQHRLEAEIALLKFEQGK